MVSKDPNTNICEICAGYPGSLPVLKLRGREYGILAGLATHSTIASQCSFDRKHYFYPDLPKGYRDYEQYDRIVVQDMFYCLKETGSIKKYYS